MPPTTSNPSFDATTTASAVCSAFAPSIKNKTIIITGVNKGGLGYTLAASLAPHFPKLLIITGRSPTKLSDSLSSLKADCPNANVRPLLLDLSSLASVRKAAAEVLSWDDVPAIDLAINNAGVMNIPEKTFSVDGIEMHFATNHIGHFLFTNLLMEKILKGQDGAKRIINVSSVGTFVSPIRFSDIKWEAPLKAIPEHERPNLPMLKAANLPVPVDEESTYIPFGAYGMSKTANVLFSVALNKRLSEKGVLSLALHPGEIITELQRTTDKEWLASTMGKRAQSVKTLEQGAATTLVAALDPKLERPGEDGVGVYLSDCQITAQVPPYALDKTEAEKLWKLSEELVGEKCSW